MNERESDAEKIAVEVAGEEEVKLVCPVTLGEDVPPEIKKVFHEIHEACRRQSRETSITAPIHLAVTPDEQGMAPGIVLDVWVEPEAVPHAAMATSIPMMLSPSMSGSVVQDYNVVRRKYLTQYDLTQILLQRVQLARWKGEVYKWNGVIYQRLSDDELYATILGQLEGEISEVGSSGQLRGVATFTKASERLDAVPTEDPALICFRNGTLDLRNWRLLPHTPAEFFTTYINANWEPGVQGDCPLFRQFLAVAMGGEMALAQRVWEAIGYILSADMRGKKFILLQGVGNSGKSVLGNLISSFFNTEAVSNLDIFRFRDRFATSALVGKRLNISMDLPNTYLSNEAIGCIKMLTGQDSIAVEPKFRDSFSYQPTCKLVFGSNHPIRLQAPDEAFEDRILIIPFHYSVPKNRQIPNLLQQLERETPAIITQALRCYVELVNHGYQFTGGTIPALEVASAISTVGREESICAFIQQCCIIEEKAFAATATLFEEYGKFCRAKNLTIVTDKVQFSRLLNTVCTGRIKAHKRRNLGNGYDGIKLAYEGVN